MGKAMWSFRCDTCHPKHEEIDKPLRYIVKMNIINLLAEFEDKLNNWR